MENKTSLYEKTERGSVKNDTCHTILSRRNVNCSELTLEEFKAMVIEDITKARELFCLEIADEVAENTARQIAREEASRRKQAEERWKTEKRREQYVAEMMAKFKPYVYSARDFENFRVYFTSGDMFSHNISVNDWSTIDNIFEKCCHRNEYWYLATGWRICYKSDDDSKLCKFYPYFELIVDDATKKRMKDEDARLGKAVSDFYKDCKYCGD